ncbi:MAG: heme-binding protein [Aquabacterium sp.]
MTSMTPSTSRTRRLLAGSALALFIGIPAAHAQNATGLVTERGISVDAALELASTALEQCRTNGYKVSITVLNRHGRTAVALSDDGVNPHTLENSERKAYTAFTTRGPSGEVGKRPPAGQASFLLLKGVTGAEGGVPIWSGKELVGAVGVSGAPGGDKDTACAQAGIDRIAKKLGN